MTDLPDPRELGPFHLDQVVDAFADAAEAVHRPGPSRTKAQWVVQTLRRLTAAQSVAYLEVGADSPRVRATSGQSLREARRLVEGPAQAVVERAASSGDAAEAVVHGTEGDGDDREVVAIPVRGADGDTTRGLLVAVADPGNSVEPIAWVSEAFALHLGVALQTNETLVRLSQLEAAREEVVQRLQEAVRPEAPVLDGAELGVHYQPADPGAPIGGDLYDWHVLPDGDLHMAVIDVAGKGVTATKDALAVAHTLRVLVLEGVGMDELVARADAVFTESQQDVMATLMVCRYSPETGTITVVGGGHPPALVVSAEGDTHFLEARGVPIGWPGAGSRGLVEHTLGLNDAVVLFTDGIVEATGDIIQGFDDLEAAAREVARYPAHYLARGLVERALAGASRRDDSLALVLRHRVLEHPARPVLGPLVYRFSPSAATVPLVRHFLHDWLGHQPVDPALHEDLLFVTTELCGNAVTAATGAPGSIQLRAAIDGDAVVIEVEDDGEGYELAVHNTRPPLDAEAGRGLFLVRALTDDLTVERVGERTVTRAVVRSAVLAEEPGGDGPPPSDGNDA